MIERNLRTKDFLWKLCEPRENGMIFFRVLKGKGKKLECHARWKYFPKRKAKNPRLCRETHVEGMPLQQACSEAVEEGPDT